MKKSRLRIKGTDRGYMMLARDVRRRWLQYGENRKEAYDNATWDDSSDGTVFFMCPACNTLHPKNKIEIDHIKPVGTRPRKPEDFGLYIDRMFNGKCQALCRKCNQKKGDK